MSKSKHSPGPWAVSPHPWPEQIGCCPLPGRPYSVHAADNRNVAAARTKEIARLIAAAPEMYEALRPFSDIALDHAVDVPEWRDLDSISVVVSVGELRRARAAIVNVGVGRGPDEEDER